MSNSKVRTINGLMKHLRDNGVEIRGSKEKQQLINFGYYHGYKGYRCFQSVPRVMIPFTNFKEIVATIEYDGELKTILYPKLMFVETALESIVCQKIVEITGSTTFNSMMNTAIQNYNRFDPWSSSNADRAKKQKDYFDLKKQLEGNIAKAYTNNLPKITHFIESTTLELPIWPVFELLTLGEVQKIIQYSILPVRNAVSNVFGIGVAIDSKRNYLGKMINQLRFLRNAVAHNDVVFDNRFKHNDAPNNIYRIFQSFGGLSSFQCDNIFDYFVILAWFMEKLGCSKTEIKNFLNAYKKATDSYKTKIPSSIQNIVIPNNYSSMVSTVISNL